MLKIVSWNIAHRPDAWRALIDADTDIALLQEACEPPGDIASRYDVGAADWRTHGGGVSRPWRAALVALTRRVRLDRIPAKAITEAGPQEFAVSRVGSLDAAHVVDSEDGNACTLISMYAAWERSHASAATSWIYADASAHRLISDVSILVGREKGHRVLAAGDLNILHGHGENGNAYWRARYHTIFDRLGHIGLRFAGPQFPNGRQADPWPRELPTESLNVPTFHTNRQTPGTATRQLDFVFASADLLPFVQARALNRPEEWGLSDHCRVAIEVGSVP